ncbi:TPA: DUF5960 family protein [Streptococcus suis]
MKYNTFSKVIYAIKMMEANSISYFILPASISTDKQQHTFHFETRLEDNTKY